jgi:hypothetical protein
MTAKKQQEDTAQSGGSKAGVKPALRTVRVAKDLVRIAAVTAELLGKHQEVFIAPILAECAAKIAADVAEHGIYWMRDRSEAPEEGITTYSTFNADAEVSTRLTSMAGQCLTSVAKLLDPYLRKRLSVEYQRGLDFNRSVLFGTTDTSKVLAEIQHEAESLCEKVRELATMVAVAYDLPVPLANKKVADYLKALFSGPRLDSILAVVDPAILLAEQLPSGESVLTGSESGPTAKAAAKYYDGAMKREAKRMKTQKPPTPPKGKSQPTKRPKKLH